eukprot:CAMPEP_0179245724 /NCGR_PEP_ID=MMETSP0797-20121207/18723_1 /TAXON_ID=47934 /ORGANISM="Dinophysis acuminata, Strain DAEP01" /LENGTH=39 /DNA_ID= /DNA_START= /DNA_END= /DNA_ORIENTATION=
MPRLTLWWTARKISVIRQPDFEAPPPQHGCTGMHARMCM